MINMVINEPVNEPLTMVTPGRDTKGNGNLEEVGGSSVALAHSLDAPRTVLEKEDFEVRGCVICMHLLSVAMGSWRVPVRRRASSVYYGEVFVGSSIM